MKYRIFCLTSLFIFTFINLALSENQGLYATTYYLYKGQLFKKAPRSTDVVEVKTWQGSISENTTWESDKIITGDLTIEASATLTIKPGVTIYFPKVDEDGNAVGDTDFIVEGRLNCQGLPNKKVVFTSYHNTKNNKDWAGIDFQSSTGQVSTISNAEILYAYEAVNIKSQDVTFNSCRIAYANQYGLKMEEMISTNVVTIRNSIIESCGTYGVSTNNGRIYISNSSIRQNGSYGLKQDLGSLDIVDSIIEGNKTYGLTMEKGTLNISNLTIQSTSGDGIILKPEVIVNANELVSIKNSQKGLHIDELQDASFINCQFSENGNYGILIENSEASFVNCIINKNSWSGVKVQKKLSDITFKHCTVNENQRAGFYFEDQTTGDVTYSTIEGNKGFGVKLAATSNPSFNFNHIYGNTGSENTGDSIQYFDDDDWIVIGKNTVSHPSNILTSKRYIRGFYYRKDGDSFTSSYSNWYYYNYSQILYKGNSVNQNDWRNRLYSSGSYNMPTISTSFSLNNYVSHENDIQIKIYEDSNSTKARLWVYQYYYNYLAPSGYQVAAIVTPETRINFKNNYWRQEATNNTINSFVYSENLNINIDNHSWDPFPNVGSTLSVHASKNVKGIANSEVKVPITIINYTNDLNVISFQFTVDYNSEILSAKGILKEGTLTENWEIFTDVSDGKKISVRGINIDPLQYGKDVLINLLFDVRSDVEVGEISTFDFTDFKINSDIEDIVKENGRFQVIKETFTVSGDVVYFNNDNPIPGTTMTIDGGEHPMEVLTDSNGEYAIPGLKQENYIVAPSKDLQISDMIITPYDASLVAQYALNLITLNEYQIKAAKVDADDKVTVFDASTIAKYSVGLINQFDKGAWIFDPPSQEFTLDRDMISQFKGIVIGDVSGNWTASDNNQNSTPSDFIVRIPDISEVSTDETIQIPIETDLVTGSKIYSYFIEIEYNPDIVTFTNISKTETLSANCPNPAVYTNDSGILRIAAFGTEPLKGEGALIFLKGQIKGNDDEMSLLTFKRFAFNEGAPKVTLENGSILIGENPLSVSPEKIEIQKNSGQLSIDIITGDASMSWQAITNDAWLTIDGNTNGMGSGKLMVNYSDNPGTARSGSITISSAEAANGPQTVSIYQFGMYQLQIEDISADPGDPLSVPIIMNNPDGEAIESIHYSIEYDPTILDLTEISFEGSIIENADVMTEQNIDTDGLIILSFLIKEDHFTSAGKLTTLNFNVIGTQGDSSVLKFTNAMINAKQASADDGMFIIGYIVSGYVGYYDVFSREVPGVTLMINDFKTVSNEMGQFYLKNIPSNAYYSLVPSKTTDLAGLTMQDAISILKYTVNKASFSCSERLAADVSQDGIISPLDAAKVAKFIVKYETGTDYCMNDTCTHWIFSTESIQSCENDMPIIFSNKHEYSPLEQNMADQNFYAYRLGDINKTWIEDEPSSRKSERTLSADDIPEIFVKPGFIFTLPVLLNEIKDINGILLSVTFDSDVIQPTGGNIDTGILAGFELQQEISVPDIAAFGIYSTQLVQGSGKLIDLSFEAMGKKQSTIVSIKKLDCNDLQASGGFLVNTITTTQFKVTIDVPEPEIFTIEDQIIKESSLSNTIPLTITIPPIPGGLTQLSATSSNTDLVPLSNIVFESNGNIVSLIIHPEKGHYGTSEITITLTDSYGRTASSSFTITVDPLPDSQINVVGCGKVSINGIETSLPWTGRFDYDLDVFPITAIPCNENWRFDHWSGDINSVNPTITIPSHELKTLKASFAETSVYRVNINAQSLDTQDSFQIKVNNTIHTLPWSGEFIDGSLVQLDIVNITDFQGWTGDISSGQTSLSLTMDKDINLTALFYAFEMLIKKGWSQFSSPLKPLKNEVTSLFPEGAYVYRYIEGMYVETDKIVPGIGYWVYSPVETTIKITGEPFTAYKKRTLSEGWFLIGALSQVSPISVVPEDAIDGIYEYKDGIYVEVPTLKPGYGYFIHVSMECEIGE
ncbi:MAG: right-handed parallel beta-helix repeat-containing protein [Candidatus Magnetomorum sp.]|nr:right-handed parallel beta-helix repeat-containing protein [Candidatus Magnetomorum sp.]